MPLILAQVSGDRHLNKVERNTTNKVRTGFLSTGTSFDFHNVGLPGQKSLFGKRFPQL